MYIDCHCHLDLLKSLGNVIERAKAKRVKLIVANGVDVETNRKVVKYANKFSEVRAALGVYPIDALKMNKRELDKEIEFIRTNSDNIIAIGEVGIDWKESSEVKKQEENFRKFVKLSIELDKPVIVHSRKAEERCIEILEEEKAKKVVMHCFSGKFKLVKRIVDNGWFLTIPTCVTRSEQFQKIASEMPIEKLLCETDSPFLHPFGKRNNEPGNVVESYKTIAKIKKMKLKDVERRIEANFKELFG